MQLCADHRAKEHNMKGLALTCIGPEVV
jgi:hypothetical protein